MDWVPVNFALLKHPVNWITVWLMLLIAGFIVDLALQYHNSEKVKS